MQLVKEAASIVSRKLPADRSKARRILDLALAFVIAINNGGGNSGSRAKLGLPPTKLFE